MGLGLALRLTSGLLDGDLYYSTGTVNITPSAGAELLANGGFDSWTGDNPDGWSVTETAPDPECTERDPNQGHADTKTVGGAANLFSSATAIRPQLTQNVLTVGKFFKISGSAYRVGGSVGVRDAAGGFSYNIIASGAWDFTGRAADTLFLARGGAGTNLTLDDVSVKMLSALVELHTHAVAYGDFSVTLTAAGTKYQGGVVFNYSDANNYVLCNFNRIDGKVYLIKYVTGTPTVLGSWSATYSAGAVLTARRHKDGTIDVIYNGVTLASGIAATGLAGLQAGPFKTDASGVTIGSYTWDARTTT
jgi:hypothetical protein